MSDILLQELKGLGEQAEKNKAAIEAKFNEQVNSLTEKLNNQGASIGQMAEEVRELKKKSGALLAGAVKEVKSIEGMIANKVKELGEGFFDATKGKDGIQMVTKAVGAISSANLTGDNYVSYLDAQAGMRPFGQDRVRDFIRTVQSNTDFVQYPRDNGGEGGFARQASEGAAKSQIDRDFAMQNLTLTPVAGYATVSRQSLRNIPFLQSYLPQTMLEDLLDKEDELFSAVITAAATGATTVGADTSYIAKIIYYIKNLKKAKYNANAIAIDPDVWAEILLTKPADYSTPNAVTIDANGNVKVLGRTLTAVNWLTGGSVIVADWSKAAIVESEGLSLRQSEHHGSNFTQNQITFLMERTEDVAIFRPDAFIYADLVA